MKVPALPLLPPRTENTSIVRIMEQHAHTLLGTNIKAAAKISAKRIGERLAALKQKAAAKAVRASIAPRSRRRRRLLPMRGRSRIEAMSCALGRPDGAYQNVVVHRAKLKWPRLKDKLECPLLNRRLKGKLQCLLAD